MKSGKLFASSLKKDELEARVLWFGRPARICGAQPSPSSSVARVDARAVMSHYASEGFDKPGGVDKEEYDYIKGNKGIVEGVIFRVISQPNSVRAGVRPSVVARRRPPRARRDRRPWASPSRSTRRASRTTSKSDRAARAAFWGGGGTRSRRYVDNGWRDEGFESPVEKECIDWINTKPDCSLEVVLKNNPDLAEKLKHGRPTDWAAKKEWERQQDKRRGKFI